MGEPVSQWRRGVGSNQGRVLGILVIMDPRSVPGAFLAEVAYPTGDLTQGRRVLTTLAERGLIVKAGASVWTDRDMRNRWAITPAGREAFYVWFANRVRAMEEVPS